MLSNVQAKNFKTIYHMKINFHPCPKEECPLIVWGQKIDPSNRKWGSNLIFGKAFMKSNLAVA